MPVGSQNNRWWQRGVIPRAAAICGVSDPQLLIINRPAQPGSAVEGCSMHDDLTPGDFEAATHRFLIMAAVIVGAMFAAFVWLDVKGVRR